MPLKLFGGGAGGDRRKDGGASSSKHNHSLHAHDAPSSSASTSNNDKELKGLQLKVGRTSVTVERKIAEGGFAVVLLVVDNRSGHRYALKRQFIKDDTRQLEACKRECQIVRSLSDHKNIVSFVDSDLLKHRDGVHEYLLLTEYYRHSVLALLNERLMAGSHLTIGEILAIFCDMCEAVSRLHHSQTPVIHRDLKVENILIDSRRLDAVNFVLCDFGSATTRVLSTATHSHSQVEEEILKNTTLSYRAPEMIDLYAGKPISTKADIWALGVMLYKLCYFALPFGESALAIQNATFSFPERPEFPQELKALTKRLLHPDLDLRPDIYQVSVLAFHLAGRRCPVANLNQAAQLHISDLVRDYFGIEAKTAVTATTDSVVDDEERSQSALALVDDTTTPTGVLGVSTTVNPRLRPKGNPAVSGPIPKVDAHMVATVTTPFDSPRSTPRTLPASQSSSNPELVASANTTSPPPPSHQQPPPSSSNVVVVTANNDNATPLQSYQSPQATAKRFVKNKHSAIPAVDRQQQLANTDNDADTSGVKKPPHDLGFTDLEEPPVPRNPFADQIPFVPKIVNEQSAANDGDSVDASTLSPAVANEESLLSFSPASSTQPSSMISVEIRSSAPQLGPQPGLLTSPVVASTIAAHGHRRNASDTSAIFQSDRHASAFRPYRNPSQPEAIDVQAALRSTNQGGTAVAKTHFAEADVEESTVSEHSQPRRGLATTRSPPDDSCSVSATALWNPFSEAPFGSTTAQISMDDRSFGERFDQLPRSKRSGSASSTSNVKSRESLVMTIDENDPFGAAPFKPPAAAVAKQKKGSKESCQTLKSTPSPLDGRPTPTVPEDNITSGRYVTSSRSPKRMAVGGASGVPPSSSGVSGRYRKLVEENGGEGSSVVKLTPLPLNVASLSVPPLDYDYDADSVGSASDLKQRMMQTSTTDDEHDGDASGASDEGEPNEKADQQYVDNGEQLVRNDYDAKDVAVGTERHLQTKQFDTKQEPQSAAVVHTVEIDRTPMVTDGVDRNGPTADAVPPIPLHGVRSTAVVTTSTTTTSHSEDDDEVPRQPFVHYTHEVDSGRSETVGDDGTAMARPLLDDDELQDQTTDNAFQLFASAANAERLSTDFAQYGTTVAVTSADLLEMRVVNPNYVQEHLGFRGSGSPSSPSSHPVSTVSTDGRISRPSYTKTGDASGISFGPASTVVSPSVTFVSRLPTTAASTDAFGQVPLHAVITPTSSSTDQKLFCTASVIQSTPLSTSFGGSDRRINDKPREQSTIVAQRRRFSSSSESEGPGGMSDSGDSATGICATKSKGGGTPSLKHKVSSHHRGKADREDPLSLSAAAGVGRRSDAQTALYFTQSTKSKKTASSSLKKTGGGRQSGVPLNASSFVNSSFQLEDPDCTPTG